MSLFCFWAVAWANVPAGFEALDEKETNLVSVYFNGVKLGEFLADFDAEQLRFIHPDKVFSHLEGLKNPSVVKQALSQSFPLSEPSQKKSTSDQSIRVQFDRDHYKVTLLIAPALLKKARQGAAQYLSDSTAGVSLINDWHVTRIETVNADDSVLQHQLHLASGNLSFNLEDALQSSQDVSGYQIQQLSAEWQTQKSQYSLGFQNSFSTVLLPQFQYVGASLATNMDLLTNAQHVQAVPVEVSLLQPAYVRVYKNNVLMSTQYFTAGNHYLKTEAFPNGVYPIKIVIDRVDGQQRTKHWLFSKSLILPLRDVSEYYFSMGQVFNTDPQSVLPQLSSLDVAQFFMQHRLTDLWGVQTNWLVTNHHYLFGELALVNVQPHFNLSFGMGGFIPYALGVFTQFNSYYKWLTFSAMYRQLWHQASLPSDPLLNQDINDYDNDLALGLGLPIWRGRLSLSVNLTHSHTGLTDQESVDYTVPIWQGQQTEFSITVNASRDEEESTFFVRFAWQFEQGSWQSQVDHESEGQYAGHGVANPAQFNQASTIWQVHPSLSLSADVSQGSSQGVSTTINYANDQFHLKLQNAVNQTAHAPWLYSGLLDFNTSTVSASVAPLMLVYPKPEAGIVAKVVGVKDGQFMLFKENQSVQPMQANQTCFLPLQAYQRYQFSSESSGENLLTVTPKSYQVVLYQYNIQSLLWHAAPAVLLMGYFVTPKGQPLSGYQISSGLYPAETDSDGFAQVEVIAGEPLMLKGPDGQNCRAVLPKPGSDDGVLYAEQVVCRAS